MNIGIQLLLQYPLGSDAHSATRSLIKQAKTAEELGYDSVWLPHHDVPPDCDYFDPLMLAGGIATVTNKLRIAVREIRVTTVHPVRLAQHLATLDVMSRGRLILNPATEYRKEASEAFNVPFDENRRRLRESLELLKKLWNEDSVTHHGKYYNISNVSVNPKTLQRPSPPIWIRGYKKEEIELVAEMGDAWYPEVMPSLKQLKESLEVYKKALKRIGKSIKGRRIPLMRDCYVAKTRRDAWKEYAPHILEKYQTYFTWGISKEDLLIKSDKVTIETLKDRLIVGSPEDCVEEIRKYEEGFGVTDLCIRINLPGMPDKMVEKTVRTFGEKVLPHFS